MSWWILHKRKPKPTDSQWAALARDYIAFRETAKPGAIWAIPEEFTVRDIQRLDAEMLAEEKLHPSCMWDWISPARIKRPYE